MTQAFLPSIGGIEVMVSQRVKALAREGFEFWVVCGGDGPDQFEGVPISRLPFDRALRQRDPEAALTCANELKRIKNQFVPHLVHAHVSDANIFFHWKTFNVCPCPTIASFHNALESYSTAQSLLATTLQRCERVTADSRAVLDGLQRIATCGQDKLSLLYPSTPDTELIPNPLPFDPPQLLVIARLVVEKGVDLAIRAMDILVERFPGLRLFVLGEGPQRPQLEVMAQGRPVTFVGSVDPLQIAPWINRSTLLVFPSRWKEAFGLVALEAARLQRPVVAARVGGIPEVVLENVTGLLVPADDADALADSVGQLLHNPERAVALGLQGREYAAQRFSWGDYLQNHRRLYTDLARL